MTENTALTTTQRRVVEVLAADDYRTATEAAAKAGVSRAALYRTRQNETAQREVLRLKAERSDKARDLKRVSASKLAQRIAEPDVADNTLMGVYKLATDAVAQGVDEDSSADVTPHEMAHAYQRRLKDFAAGIQYEQRRQRRAAQRST
jgi:hypothetical protein